MVLVVYSLIYALSVGPIGVLAERLGQRGLLLGGMVCLALSQGLLATTYDVGWLFWLGIMLWGLHMGMTQGLLATRVAQLAPQTLRGTSFGLFYLTTGVLQLVAGVVFGWLWVTYSAGAAFTVAAFISMASLPLLWMVWHPQQT